ncbi:DUF3857 domain-containing protein [Aquimarina sp. MMG016]|uniref:DUF3857 domain-containing protein n=1 Tax=Aquimarina sp. MMG016 TaxID=2822690 RepID=UPI001B39D459|nr:DUF3857 domain-containing protein [Aquimarina sp. MMG016]MBQ4821158.1 DUF3857 domain-containing protein [Aquimarina sp. MMG016]
MSKPILLLFLITFSFLTTAQQAYNTKNAVVSMADLKNNIYTKDSTANAFYIYEKGYSRVENGGRYNLLTNYEAKIKILNEQGFKKATVEVYLYQNKNNKEKIRDIVAYTHNLENNKIVKTKVDKKQIFREKYNERYTVVKFTFPNLKPGSVLTYKYQTESPFMYNFNGWDFQDDIPKMYSEFTADLPGNYIYNIRLIGPLKLKTNESKIIRECLDVRTGTADCSHNVYTMENIPAFEEEEHMTAKKNYFSRIEYELKEFKGFDGKNKKYTETWKNVDNELKKEQTIGLQLKKINITKDILPDNIQSKPNDLTKAKSIYNYIADNYKWNEKYQIFRNNESSLVKKVIENKTGNVSGINILLHNTLKEQGFKVNSVLLSTRTNGYPTKLHPVISDFNYLVVQLSLDDKTYLLDATENTLEFGQLPFRCLNQYGRLLDFKNGSSWVDIKPQRNSSYFFREELILDNNLVLKGKAKHISTGYHSYDKRKKFDQINKESFITNIKKQNESVAITDFSIKNEKDTEKPFEEEFTFRRNIEEIDNEIYIKPFTRPFFKENPFRLNERTYPVDFGYQNSYTYLISIEIPEGYDFIDIPKNIGYTIPNKLGTVKIGFQRNGNKLMLNHRIAFNSSYYPSEYYSILKEFFNLIVQIENDTLITVKKTS